MHYERKFVQHERAALGEVMVEYSERTVQGWGVFMADGSAHCHAEATTGTALRGQAAIASRVLD
jgi:hypothetical protein